MSRRDHNTVPGASIDVPGLCGPLLCVLLPLLAWFCLQPMGGLHLTETAWANGAWHTLWTGHLMHYGMEHFVWDALMFASFAFLLWKEERWRLWAWILLAAPLISLAVFTVHPELTEYRGLSALDTMLFARYCLGSFRVLTGWQRWCFAALPLAALATKIAFEFISESTLFVGSMGPGVVPLPSAHLAGALLGLVWFASAWDGRRPAFTGEAATKVHPDESSGKTASSSLACVSLRRSPDR